MRHPILVALLMLSLHATAQVSMTAQLPPTGVMQKAQLWNIMLVSASATPIRVHLQLRVVDAQTNQPILTGASRTIILNKGAKQLQIGDVSPVTYEYLANTADRGPNGLLTAGSYLACFSLLQERGDASSLVAETCLPFAVEPVAPPLLNTPANESLVEGNLPQFGWIPPAPINIFSDLNYDVTIVEVRNNQSAAEAIQQNIPVYHSVRNKNQYLNYPVSAVALDTAKKYAWVVIANNGTQFVAQTETWTFRIKGVTTAAITPVEYAYVQLKRGLDVQSIVSTGSMLFSYVNDASDNKVTYEIISLDTKSSVVQTGTLTLNRGPNQVTLTLNTSAMTSGKSYLFRILNGRNEYWNAKFIYNKK